MCHVAVGVSHHCSWCVTPLRSVCHTVTVCVTPLRSVSVSHRCGWCVTQLQFVSYTLAVCISHNCSLCRRSPSDSGDQRFAFVVTPSVSVHSRYRVDDGRTTQLCLERSMHLKFQPSSHLRILLMNQLLPQNVSLPCHPSVHSRYRVDDGRTTQLCSRKKYAP